jgi:hypothetical protein
MGQLHPKLQQHIQLYLQVQQRRQPVERLHLHYDPYNNKYNNDNTNNNDYHSNYNNNSNHNDYYQTDDYTTLQRTTRMSLQRTTTTNIHATTATARYYTTRRNTPLHQLHCIMLQLKLHLQPHF